MIKELASLSNNILDRLPGRRESLIIKSENLKDELKKLQSNKNPWTPRDVDHYINITEQLSKIEYRIKISK